MTPYELRIVFKLETGESHLAKLKDPDGFPSHFLHSRCSNNYYSWLETLVLKNRKNFNESRKALQMKFYRENGKRPTSHFFPGEANIKRPESYSSLYGEFLEEILYSK